MRLGVRLKEERKRLALTQQALADLCGVSKRQQLNYESEAQMPGSGYLAEAALIGVDVNYVLTGNAAGRMDPLEAMLLASFRAASDEVKAVVIAALGAARPKPKPKPAPRAAGTVFKRATIGQQISGDVSQKGMVIKVAGDASKKKKRN